MSKKYWAIDLGTTNSAIAYSTNDVTELIAFPNGQKQIPSVVYKMGDATPQAIPERSKSLFLTSQNNPDDHIFEAWKLLLGDERGNKGATSHRNVVADENITPVVLSSIILKKIITDAEKATGDVIRELCVSIPANFNEVARMNTVKAIKLAAPKIENIKLVHEPTAAAISTLETASKESLTNKTFGVFDIGGGTTDISIVRFISSGDELDIEVKGSDGENIAGKSFDGKILQNFIRPAISQKIKELNSEADIKNILKDNNGLLMYTAEQMKLKFSKEQDDIIEVIKLVIDGKEEKITIDAKYDDFLNDIKPMFEHLIEKFESLLSKLKIQEYDVEKIILAGSSSAGPWVKQFLAKKYGKDKIAHNPSFEGAIAKGASIISGINFNKGIFEYKKDSLTVGEVVSHNIGINTNTSLVTYFISKNAPIPIKKINDNLVKSSAEDFDLFLLESDNNSPFFRDVNVIGKITLKNVAMGKLSMEFVYDNENKLTINMTDSSGRKHNNVEIIYEKNDIYIDDFKELANEHSKMIRSKFGMPSPSEMKTVLEAFLSSRKIKSDTKAFILNEANDKTKLEQYFFDIVLASDLGK